MLRNRYYYLVLATGDAAVLYTTSGIRKRELSMRGLANLSRGIVSAAIWAPFLHEIPLQSTTGRVPVVRDHSRSDVVDNCTESIWNDLVHRFWVMDVLIHLVAIQKAPICCRIR